GEELLGLRATAANGEDTYVRCPSCGFAANVEAVKVPVPVAISYGDAPAMHLEQTPGSPTIATLVDCLNARYPKADGTWGAPDTLKTVVVMLVHPDGTREPLAIGLPGDREIDEKRLGAQVDPATVEAFQEQDFAVNPALVKGYMGPTALGVDSESGVRFLVDPRVVPGTRWVAGGNRPDVHAVDLVAGRDFTPDGTIEAAEVRDGDECPSCGHAVQTARGIEMGHIFALGRKYAEALGLKVLDQSGRLVTVIMGSYGVGVSRAVACVAEGNHDELGLIWPREISPCDVHLVATGKDEAVFLAAEDLVRGLEAHGVTVLYDDRRGVSPGVKFTDSELIGVPTIVVVGRGLERGVVEVKDRRSGLRREVALESSVADVVAEVRGLSG
ncbi:MAG TPA: His/Gly/Thr/Pro-type tRNA ligase C-terminal domain-containing protein, partial [Candidatus Lustribacter sp.]|nr:His/Gly/Thr/Pro-type tRNA ligase C-terminal domain-containing protein [Candidatus Lustribacter sp.]